MFLSNRRTNWDTFRAIMDNHVNCNVFLKTTGEVEEHLCLFTHRLQQRVRETTPKLENRLGTPSTPSKIKLKIVEKQRLTKVNIIYGKQRTQTQPRTNNTFF